MARVAAAVPVAPLGAPLRAPAVERFASAEALDAALSARIAGRLARAVEARGQASLALSGGSTPRRLYRALGQRSAPWDQVGVTLVDERFVDPSSPDSNQGLVRETLLAGEGRRARFIPLRGAADTAEGAADTADAALRTLAWPLDVVVLGLGEDGHTASLFPGSTALAEALDPASTRLCLAVPPAQPAPAQARLTLTLRAILDARLVVLLIAGEAKLQTLARALGPGAATDMPVRAVLRQTRTPVEIAWSPAATEEA